MISDGVNTVIMSVILLFLLPFHHLFVMGMRTTVQLSVGGFGNSVPSYLPGDGKVYVNDTGQSGSFPIYNEQGSKIGQINGHKNGHIGFGVTQSFSIPHEKDDESQRTLATYLAVYMIQSDAICISQIKMQSENGVMHEWLGDIGFACGYEWYYNDIPANAYGYQPKCTWIDSDGNRKFQGMGIHMLDFFPTPARVLQYHNEPRSLCSSPPRFQMYEYFTNENGLPTFQPALLYNDNMTDVDLTKVIDVKGVAKGRNVPIYNATHPEALAEYRMFGMDPSRKFPNGTKLRPRTPYPRGHDVKLISSDYEAHDVFELCEPKGNSRGPDFVSLQQKMFCDMSTKEVWPLCDNDKGIKHECFDYGNKVMVGSSNGAEKRDIQGREIPTKEYSHEFVWRTGWNSTTIDTRKGRLL